MFATRAAARVAPGTSSGKPSAVARIADGPSSAASSDSKPGSAREYPEGPGDRGHRGG